jgi:hypothetical protein
MTVTANLPAPRPNDATCTLHRGRGFGCLRIIAAPECAAHTTAGTAPNPCGRGTSRAFRWKAMITMKVARSALPVTLAHWERAGVRETVMAAAATYILWGGADAMAVSELR